MTDISIDNVQSAIKELRETFEVSTKKSDALVETKMQKINDFLNSQETKNQELTAKIAQEQKAVAELKEKHQELEKSLSQLPSFGNRDESKATALELEVKAVEDFLRVGTKNDAMVELERKYLRTDKLEDGGALIPVTYAKTLIKDVTEFSPIRAYATTRQAPISKMEIPIRTGLVTVYREGEGESTLDSNSKYGKRSMKLHRYTVNVPVTYEELNESMINVESEIRMDFLEALGEAQGYDFVKGVGAVGAKGFLQHAEVGEFSVSGGVVTMDGVIALAGEVKTKYAKVGKYYWNRGTLTQLRLKKDSTNQYLWVGGNIAAGIPNTFNGYEYVETPDMDDYNTVNGNPVVFGDMRVAYLIGDSLGVRVTRDPYSLKKRDMIEFTFVQFTGGDVVQPEAIKKMKVTS